MRTTSRDHRLLLGLLLALTALVLALACGGGDGPSENETSTAAAEDSSAAQGNDSGTGPNAAGIVTLLLADNRPIDVWYPADESSATWRPRGGSASFPVGDVNCDEQVSSVDALLILQFDAHFIESLPFGPLCVDPPAKPYPYGDVNCSGHVNSIDALLTLQFDAHLLESLPFAPLCDPPPKPLPVRWRQMQRPRE